MVVIADFNFIDDAELREVAGESEKIAKAMLTIEKLSADEEERVRAEYQEMMRRDYVSRINGAKREGHAEGIEQGIEQGRAEELQKAYENTLAAARRMKADNMTPALIGKYTGLTRDEIAML